MLALDVGLLVGGTKERGELETRVTNILAECRDAGDVIVMCDITSHTIDICCMLPSKTTAYNYSTIGTLYNRHKRISWAGGNCILVPSLSTTHVRRTRAQAMPSHGEHIRSSATTPLRITDV